jgi:hypothetical protein
VQSGRQLGLAIILSVATGSVAQAALPEPAVLRLRIDDRIAVPVRTLKAAQAQAAALYKQIGVSIVWTANAPGQPPPDFVVAFLSARTIRLPRRWDEAFGASPASHDDDRTALIFYDRIDRLMRSLQADPSCLLGYIVAHEVGHLLLPGVPHAANGIMQPHFPALQLYPGRVNLVRFSPLEGARIRERIDAMRRQPAAWPAGASAAGQDHR